MRQFAGWRAYPFLEDDPPRRCDSCRAYATHWVLRSFFRADSGEVLHHFCDGCLNDFELVAVLAQ